MGLPEQPHRYHHGDLRNALLAAAQAQLASAGPAGLSLREVARAAGVSHAAPYRHFRDRNALLLALRERGFTLLQEAMRTAVAAVPHGPEQQLVAAGIAYVRQAVRQPAMAQLIFGGVISDAAQADTAVTAEFGNIIERGIASGVFRRRETEELAMVAWTSMHGLAMLVTAGMLQLDLNDERALEASVSTLASNVIYGIMR